MGFQKYIPQKPFCDWWRIFNAFVSTCAVAFHTTHVQNKTHRFDTKILVPVSSLCGVVCSTSWFTKCLVGSIVNIWSSVYINARCIYSSETCTYTMIECTIDRNVQHVTSTWSFIYWWSGAANTWCTTRTERPSWNSLEVNWVPVSFWILYISHKPN